MLSLIILLQLLLCIALCAVVQCNYEQLTVLLYFGDASGYLMNIHKLNQLVVYFLWEIFHVKFTF